MSGDPVSHTPERNKLKGLIRALRTSPNYIVIADTPQHSRIEIGVSGKRPLDVATLLAVLLDDLDRSLPKDRQGRPFSATLFTVYQQYQNKVRAEANGKEEVDGSGQ